MHELRNQEISNFLASKILSHFKKVNFFFSYKFSAMISEQC